jgi:hypothetical protein
MCLNGKGTTILFLFPLVLIIVFRLPAQVFNPYHPGTEYPLNWPITANRIFETSVLSIFTYRKNSSRPVNGLFLSLRFTRKGYLIL